MFMPQQRLREATITCTAPARHGESSQPTSQPLLGSQTSCRERRGGPALAHTALSVQESPEGKVEFKITAFWDQGGRETWAGCYLQPKDCRHFGEKGLGEEQPVRPLPAAHQS